MDKQMTLAGGVGLGAGLMYLCDPIAGRRRRALLRDKVVSAFAGLDDCLSTLGRDLGHRAVGLGAEAKALFTTKMTVSDRQLVERVRSKLGRYCSHSRSLEITADNGRVTLTGPILAAEVDQVLEAARSVPGVGDVDNQLEPHQEAGDISALQGGRTPLGERSDVFQANWSPSTRFLIGATGCGLVGFGLTRKYPEACVLGTIGIGLLARAFTNMEMKRLLGYGGRRGIDFQKTIHIAAPVEDVYGYWSDFSNFPLFMRNVRQVQDLGGDRSRWTVAGPAGVPVQWEAVITQEVPNEIIAWKSVDGSVIRSTGIVRFEPAEDDTTRVVVRMSYNPPAGMIGHAVASLFGADPKTEMDEDLMRMKSFLETGVLPRDSARRAKPAMAPLM